MKLRNFASAILLLAMAAAASAQTTDAHHSHGNFGIYLNPMATRISNSQVDNSSFSFLGLNTTSRVFWGLQMGGYYDFFHAGPLAAGATMRWSDEHAANAGVRNFQVGARISAPLRADTRVRPYAEVTIGDTSTKPERATVRISKAAYTVYGGADYSLANHFDWRVFEVGYGSVTTASGGTVGQGNGIFIPASKLLSFSSGFVIRF